MTAARTQRYFEDVNVGDELPGLDFTLDATRMVLQVSGSQDFYPAHHDAAFAHAAGHRGIFYNTGFTRACLGRLLTDYVGDDGWVKRLRFQMRRMHVEGDVMRIRGRVAAVRPETSEVDIELWAENDREGIATPASATVTLPRRT